MKLLIPFMTFIFFIFLLLTSSILLISSCTQCLYHVEGDMCESDMTELFGPITVSFITDKKPVLIDNSIEKSYLGNTEIVSGICDFSYQRNPIE